MKKIFILLMTIIIVSTCSVNASAFWFDFEIMPAPNYVNAIYIGYDSGLPGGVTVSFEEVEGAKAYNVIFYGESFWDIHIISTESTTIKFLETHTDWFDADTNWTISVQAVDEYWYGIPSKPINLVKMYIPEFNIPIYV